MMTIPMLFFLIKKTKIQIYIHVCYVHLNIMFKDLQQFCETPQYIDVNNSIRKIWHNLIEFANASPNNN
jgi:hypothetical protein